MSNKEWTSQASISRFQYCSSPCTCACRICQMQTGHRAGIGTFGQAAGHFPPSLSFSSLPFPLRLPRPVPSCLPYPTLLPFCPSIFPTRSKTSHRPLGGSLRRSWTTAGGLCFSHASFFSNKRHPDSHPPIRASSPSGACSPELLGHARTNTLPKLSTYPSAHPNNSLEPPP